MDGLDENTYFKESLKLLSQDCENKSVQNEQEKMCDYYKWKWF